MSHEVPEVEVLRRDLQRRIFSARVDSADSRVAARQLQQLEQSLADEASVPAPLVARDPAPVIATDAATSTYRLVRAALVIALAFAIGVAIGVTAGPGASSDPQASGAGVAEASSELRSPTNSSGAIALFDVPQRDVDHPGRTLPKTLIAESLRAVGDPSFRLYIGRNAANMVCLLAAQPADSFAMSCVTTDEFPSTGIRLEWAGEIDSVTADGQVAPASSAMRAVWRPNGTIDIGGGPR